MIKTDYSNSEFITIIRQAQKGDTKSVEKLIKHIQKYVYAFLLHLISTQENVADLTQDILIKVAKNLSKLRETKYFKNWLNQIIINTYYDFMRSNKRKYTDYDKKVFDTVKDKVSCEPQEQCLFSETEEYVISAILKLPQFLKITIILRELNGMSYKDIAKITHAGIGTVKSRISRARNRLQHELKNFI